MDPYIGKVLDGRYEILDVLGTGGMAVVYRAYDHRLNRYVAVKILKNELAADDDLRRRFHDESQAVAMLSHPNIMAVYDVSSVDGREFIVMELIEGITLKQYMRKRGGKLDWREALHFITQILQGLRHAHSRGIIHRDIKPQNVMVLRDGSVKVTDFGIARSTTSQATMTQEAIGSVHYISPEQARGSHIDARSDIYSAGVVLYEMLTGRLPYEGENPVSVAIQHINSIPVSPRELNPDIPLGLEQITLRAMASVPDRRYSSAEVMLYDLEAFRKNPKIDFGYTAPGLVTPDVDEPTMLRRGQNGFVGEEDSDATVRDPMSSRRRSAHFETDDDGDDYDDDDENSGLSKGFIIAIACVAGVLVIVLIILFFTLFRGGNKKVDEEISYQVPDILYSTVEEAEDRIAQDEELAGHFTVTVGAYVASEDYEEGVILEQDPLGGTTSSTELTVITVTVSSGEPEPDDIILEDYTGQDYRIVKEALTELGFITTFEQEYSDTIEEDLVTRTDPRYGTAMKEGDEITIYYSMGPAPETTIMQMLLGQTQDYAQNYAGMYGLNLTINYEYNDDYAKGQVCYQSISMGTEVTEGDELIITVSNGKEPVIMPDLLNKKQADAESIAASYGITLNISEEYNDNYPEGYVCYQGISAGTEIEAGSTVSITVSLGSEPVVVTSQWEITVNLPPDRTEDCSVAITINGAIIYRGTVSASETEVTTTYEGDINSSSVTVNGESYEDYDIVKLR